VGDRDWDVFSELIDDQVAETLKGPALDLIHSGGGRGFQESRPSRDGGWLC